MHQVYKLSNETIGQIVQLIQLGILTGTDITDQMKTLRVILDDESNLVVPDPDYTEQFNDNLARMQTTDDA